ncbi:MAG TPA: hypothetical protein VG871_01240 [Vicinamibacterales bacterium]|nr:hypothetical protein [Vicinamibacterales bacterium]
MTWLQVGFLALAAVAALAGMVRRRRVVDLGSVSAQWRAEHVADTR